MSAEEYVSLLVWIYLRCTAVGQDVSRLQEASLLPEAVKLL